MQSCTRRLTFSSGHRVMGHEGKCKQLHGHGYIVFVTAIKEDGGLDSIGRVIDFSVLREKIGKWIDDNWDHGMILFSEDGDAIKAVANIPDGKYFLLPSNPTAENLAEYLLKDVCPHILHGSGVTVTKVVLNETENCSAEATL